MCETPEVADAAELRLLVDVADLREEEREHDAVRHHVGDRTAHTHDVQCREAEQNVAHVGDRGIRDHILDVALRKRDVGCIDDVDHREHGDQGSPELCPERQDEEADADERVAPNLFQHARVDHRDRRRCARIAVGRPDVEREHRQMRPEPHEQEEERRDLHLPRDIAHESRGGKRLEVERTHPRLIRTHVQEEHAEQHERRTDKEEDRHLHRRVLFAHTLRRSPDEHHEICRNDDHLAEYEEEEEVAHEERPRNARNHDEQEHKVLLHTLFKMPRTVDGGKSHDT